MRIQIEKESLDFRRLRRGLGCLFGGWIISLFIVLPCAAAVPLKNYTERLERAEVMIDRLTEGEHLASEFLSSMAETKRLLPAREVVDFDGRTIQVDNTWLYEAIDEAVEIADDDPEQLRISLIEMAERLYILHERVEAAQSQKTVQTDDQHTRLEQILARKEYRSEAAQESTLKKWLDRLLEALMRLLDRIGLSRSSPGQGSGGVVEGLRILIVLVVFAAAVFGGILMIRLIRRRRRRASGEKNGTREVLGEAIGEQVTATDLLSAATELARQGDYRAAIRRAYLSVLFEMEHRGKLRLHRSKTNRDYLDDLRSESVILPPFSAMTGVFEKVWYGRARATEEEFNGFLSRYRETTRR